MNILHYSLGIYPERQGGLVRYSTDLAMEQAKQNTVYYLCPGKLGIVDKKVRLVKGKRTNNLIVYIIQNALPIPIYGGITNIDIYTRPVDQGIYEEFLIEKNINIIHIHSLMGVHVEFLRAARRLNIPILMTTHDFFGLCLITTLYKRGDVCDEKSIGSHCYDCSQNAHSYYKLAMGQTVLYKKLKSTSIVGALRKKVLLRDPDQEKKGTTITIPNVYPEYTRLNAYYKECFSYITSFLFNSSQTEEVYKSRLGSLSGEIIPLLLPTITDKRRKRSFLSDGVLHVGFMGECTEFKGYFKLKKTVEELAKENYNIELDVYNDNVVEDGFIKKKGSYQSEELDRIYDFLDLVSVPSRCYETLSFVALEAIAGGMPCLVSDHVGAKDFVEDGKTGYVFKTDDSNSLKNALKKLLLNPNELGIINDNILCGQYNFEFEDHCRRIVDKYDSVLKSLDNKHFI